MNMLENIKTFFKEQGLNWNGLIATGNDKDFRVAEEKDFEVLNNVDFWISFGLDGDIALSCEIDLITFKINGESFDCGLTAYAGKNNKNKKLCKERDLSKEWIKFQLKASGLVYAAALRIKCLEEKAKIHKECEKRRNQLTRKIDYLHRSIEKIDNNERQRSNELDQIIKIAHNEEYYK